VIVGLDHLAMDEQRVGRILRLVRRRRGLTQSELAALVGVSQQTVSSLECGQAEHATLRLLKGVAAPLGITVEVVLRWKGPELDRLADARHARIVDAVGTRLGPAWQVSVEYSFNHYGDRGSVDVIAWHAACGALLLVEVKSELDGLEAVLRPMDVKVRVVPPLIAGERGWRVRSIGSVLVLPDESTARRSVSLVGSVFALSLPARTVAVKQWLNDPVGPLRGVWFLADTPARRAIRNAGSAGRVRHPRSPESHAHGRPPRDGSSSPGGTGTPPGGSTTSTGRI
jgi:transcriptional regulator with XRE-family HTH domain